MSLILCLLPILTIGVKYLGAEHDDALYVLASHALAQGHYKMWFLPGAPPIVNGPPGLPALLLPVTWAGGESLFAYQVWMGMLTAATVGLMARLTKTRFPTHPVFLLTALLATNGLFLSRSDLVMPEIPYLAAMLWVAVRYEKSSGWELGISLLAAYLIRPAAVALWLACWTGLLFSRQWKKAGPAMLTPLAGMMVWSYWSRLEGGLQENRELLTLYFGPGSFLATAWTILRNNGASLLEITGQCFLPLRLAQGPAAFFLGIGLWGMGIYGFWRAGSAPERFLRWTAFFHLSMHLFWPYWFDRYFVPLLPLLLLGISVGLKEIPWTRRGVLGALLLSGFFFQSIPWLRADPGTPDIAPLHQWVRNYVSPNERCASFFYAREILYTGRLFVPMPTAGPHAVETLQTQQIRYVLWDKTEDSFGLSTSASPTRNLRPQWAALLSQQNHFQPVLDIPAGTLYQVIVSPPPVSTTSSVHDAR